MSNKAEIKKIVLDLGDKDIELNINQAKKLHTLLDEIFGEKISASPYSPPIIIEKRIPYWEYPYTVWSSNKYQLSYQQDSSALTYKWSS